MKTVPPCSKTACLLIHGFAGSPFEMEPLQPALEALGCTVDIPTLPGHDSTLAQFRRTFFSDWLAFAEQRFFTLRRTHKRVIPIGFSMGGAIALTLAAKHDPAAVAALAPPYKVYSLLPLNRRTSWLVLTPLLQWLRPELPMPAPKPESRALAPYRGYDSVLCLPQLHSLKKGAAAMRKALPQLRCPLLLLSAANDRICPPGGALAIAGAVRSSDLAVRFLPIAEQTTSHHMITTHIETREQVGGEIADFVKKHCI